MLLRVFHQCYLESSVHCPTVSECAVLLEKQGACLRQTLTSQEIEMIDQQFCHLKLAYCEENGIKDSLDAFRGVPLMKECWSPMSESYYLLLRTFCGGIATPVMPAGTSSVEAEFSAINCWIKDKNLPRSAGMTEFSLESILHCKQAKDSLGRCLE